MLAKELPATKKLYSNKIGSIANWPNLLYYTAERTSRPCTPVLANLFDLVHTGESEA